MKWNSQASRRRLLVEGLEQRQLLAGSMEMTTDSSLESSEGLIGEVSMITAEGEMDASMGDGEGRVSHHMMHHHIPDFAAVPTHRVSSSGNWSELASLSGVDADSVVLIEAGQTVVFDTTDVRVKAIGVVGTLRFATDQDTSITLQELLVYNSGTLEMGTEASPIRSDVTATVTIGDRPLDLGSDPAEAGNGVIVLGKIRVYGHRLEETFVGLTASPRAGDRVLQVTEVPAGWRVGDRISLPQTLANDDQPLTEEFTVVGMTATTLTLDHPVGFDRPPALDGDLTTVTTGFDGEALRGHVANLTRNIHFRSENPAGNRGHFMAVGEANLDVRYAAFEGLGRTRIGGDDPTVFNDAGEVVHQGTNQIGRYSFHFHHVSGPRDGIPVDPAVDPAGIDARQFRVIGNAISGGEKWGLTIHETHYGLVTDNVIHQVQGSGIITEAGSESFNYIANNFSFGLEGDGDTSRYDTFGDRGSAFWARSGHNYWIDNVAAAAEEAYGLYVSNAFGNSESSTKLVRVPKFPGATSYVEGEYVEDKVRNFELLGFHGNEAYGIEQFGFGSWDYKDDDRSVAPPLFEESTIWNSTGTAVYLDYNSMTFDGLIVRGHPSQPTDFAIRGHNPNGPGGPVRVQDFDIQLVQTVFDGDQRPGGMVIFEDGYSRNYDGFVISSETQGVKPRQYIFRDVQFDAVAGHPLVAIRTELSDVWDQGGHHTDAVNHSIEVLVYGYQGNPDDNFRLYFSEQAADYVIPTASEGLAKIDFLGRDPEIFFVDGRNVQVRIPERYVLGATPGQTNAEAWEQHRAAILREVAPVDAAPRPGMIGLASPLADQTVPEKPAPLPLPAFWFQSNSTGGHAPDVDIVYKDFAAQGAEAILFRVDEEAWIRETDNDGRIRLTDLSPGEHRITAAFAGPSGEPWATRGEFKINVVDETSLVAFDPLTDVILANDAGTQEVAVTGIEAGDPAHPVTMEVVSSNASVVGSASIDYVPGEATATLRYTPTGTSGTAGLVVSLRNAGADGIFGSLDDQVTTQSFTVSVGTTDASEPEAPTDGSEPDAISTPTETVAFDPLSAPSPLPIDAGEQVIEITGIAPGPGPRVTFEVISSNAQLVRRAAVDYVAGESTATLRYTPEPGETGQAVLHVRLINSGMDGAFYTGDDVSFKETVLIEVVEGPVDQPVEEPAPTEPSEPVEPTDPSGSPVLTDEVRFDPIVPPAPLPVDAPEQTLTLEGIQWGPTPRAIFEVVSSNGSLVRNAQVDSVYGESTATLRFRPEPGVTGQAVLHIRLRNAGSDGAFYSSDDVSFKETVLIEVLAELEAPAESSDPLEPTAPTDAEAATWFAPLTAPDPIASDAGEQAVVIQGIEAGAGTRAFFEVISSNSSLLSDIRVDYTQGEATAMLYFTPVAGVSGEAVLHLRLINAGFDDAYYTADDTSHKETVSIRVLGDQAT